MPLAASRWPDRLNSGGKLARLAIALCDSSEIACRRKERAVDSADRSGANEQTKSSKQGFAWLG
jgi:hypothetical protein